MKKLFLLILWITTVCSVSNQAYGSSSKLFFKPLNVNANLPTNEVRNLFQDSDGYVWIATYNGLVRYDGYSTVVYRPNGDDMRKSVNGFVNIVDEDKESVLWIGTHNGLYSFDKRKEVMQRVVSPVLRVSYIEALLCAQNGDVWVGCKAGLYRRKSGQRTFEYCSGLAGAAMDVKSIIEDTRGNLWIGTWNSGLYRYNPSEDRFYHYKKINPANSAHILFQDSKGNIWVGTWRYGLMKMENPYDMEHYAFRHFIHEKGRSGSLCDDIVYAISQDPKSGKLWVGTRSGLSILESEEEGGIFHNYLPGREGDLPFNEVNALMASRDGLMWIGMLGGGVCTVNPVNTCFQSDALIQIKEKYNTSSVKSMLSCDDGKLWLGIMGYGLMLYDPADGKAVSYHTLPSFKGLPDVITVYDILCRKSTREYCFATSDDGVWILGTEGVKRVNTETYPALADVCVYSLFEDAAGNLWMGTRAGLFVLNREGKLLSLNDLIPNDRKVFPQIPVFKIDQDRKGNIWVATSMSGVWRISCAEGKYSLKEYNAELSNAAFLGAMTLCVDAQDRVWAGTNGNGLDCYDAGKDCFISLFDDYFEPGDVVFSMLTDRDNSLWLTTNAKLFHVDVEKQTVHTFTREDGLLDDMFNRNACCKGADGELFFGGVRGFNRFYPQKIAFDATSSPIVITDLKIFNTSVREMKPAVSDRILDASLDYAKKIVLDYDQNNFSLDFSLLNYVNPQLNKFEYRLEGYDKAWIPVEAHRHFAYYSNLPYGSYKFVVRGANANGVWSAAPKTLAITILPPPWLTVWAFAAYLLVAVLVAWYIYRVVRKRLLMEQAIRIGAVERQKLEEMNHAKLQFFTNITHELLTPLSIIAASVDELQLQSPALRRQLQPLAENTTRLTRLIQQILEFRKVENGKQQLRVSQSDVSAFVRHSVQAFAPLVRKKKLRLELEGCEAPVVGYFDVDKLDKILYNLLSNAAKYTPEGCTITLRQSYDEAARQVCIRVNNPGEMIPLEQQKHLFERFYEGSYRKFHTIGTGIGLSLTKDLVELHHGKIGFACDAAEGITFWVQLPLGRDEYAEHEMDTEVQYTVAPDAVDDVYDTESVAADKAWEEDAQQESGDKPLVLLVEDNEELLEVIARMLSARCSVLKASNGEEAWNTLMVEKDIDIVVSDVMMPVMDGIALCNKIKSTFETASLPVILLTARTTDAERVEGYEVGADGYLTKPLNISVLLAKIDNLLKRQKELNTDNRHKLVFEAKELDYTSQDEAFMKQALDCINLHIAEPEFDASSFVAAMGMSRTSCNEKLKELTGMTPSAFISSVRLQAAFRLIQEKKKMRITELAYAVGFNDPKYFSLCFRKKFGASPKEFMSGKEEKAGE